MVFPLGSESTVLYSFQRICEFLNNTFSLNHFYVQDGSCNGLQHYAALGRDSVASLVNIYNMLFSLSNFQSHIVLFL
jgi:hypothetical protein